jgi:rare lipoprotein A
MCFVPDPDIPIVNQGGIPLHVRPYNLGCKPQNREPTFMSFSKIVSFLSWVLAPVVCLSGCSKKPGSSVQVGIASWYGHPFHGRPTASGEIYDMEKMTAAHRTLRLGTLVRVENLANKQIVEVRINDRGPFVHDRIIDLSHAAAQAISMPGITTVRLEVIRIPPTRALEKFAVQIGAFSQRTEAENLRAQMERNYGTAKLVFRGGDQKWSVLVGLLPTLEDANALALQLGKEAKAPAFVVLVDSAE